MAAKDVISASEWYDMMMGVANKREYKTEKAIRLVNAYARKTNYNMRQLKEAGYDFYAYDPAYATLESLYGKDTEQKFTTNWTRAKVEANLEEFMEEARAVRRFMRNDAHTLTSIKKKSLERTNWLIEHFFEAGEKKQSLLNPNSESELRVKRNLERLVSSGKLADLISEGYGNTGETMESAVYALESGATAEEIESRLENAPEMLMAYGEGKLDIEDLGRLIRGR